MVLVPRFDVIQNPLYSRYFSTVSSLTSPQISLIKSDPDLYTKEFDAP